MLEDLGLDGCEAVDWIHLAHDSVQWKTIVNALITHRAL
jgi:hypothetical protein